MIAETFLNKNDDRFEEKLQILHDVRDGNWRRRDTITIYIINLSNLYMMHTAIACL